MKKSQFLFLKLFTKRYILAALLIGICFNFQVSCNSEEDPEPEQEEVVDNDPIGEEPEDMGGDEDPGDMGGDEDPGDMGGDEDPTGLDPDLSPSENFDLSTWNISIPIDENNNGNADHIKVADLNNNYEDPLFFFTGDDGGMVFKCPIAGFKTSANTKFTRVELREMLRGTNTSISTQGISKNNWVFGSAPQSDINSSGGFDGEMNATLAVNHVTTTGDSNQVGRVIVGQIHANSDEPLRLYYRKLPNNELGSIYFAHEVEGGDDIYYEMIGSRSSSASNPADGIAIDEKFSYQVKVVNNDMWVTISREGKDDIEQYVDMSNSGYDVGGQYMYFKAGAYNQNDSGNDDDYVEVSFYSLTKSHSE